MVVSSRTFRSMLFAASVLAGIALQFPVMAQQVTGSMQEALQKAEQGDAEVQYAAAYAALSAEDTPEELLSEAVRLLQKSASAGHAASQYLLGVVYLNGHGVTRNPALAWQSLQAAAKSGNNEARNALGQMLHKGNGVPRDPAAAAEWFRLAAAEGNNEAMANLGFLYMNGLGVTKDLQKGLELTQTAADAGVTEAQHNLGWIYEKGEAIDKNIAEALRWYLLAAENGYGPAQLNAGFIYATGEAGGEMREQLTQAVKWFALASTSADSKLQNTARGAIKHMVERVPAEIIDGGLQAARKWAWTH
ncbi:tetratricopeptide repeat protein [Ferrovibrio sp.]|uniref:tetratricopeptide repeat protein n=1 Tax=Ferrovibrio sp. TaxID=1917215 RepID=UPI0025BE2A1B|nr:tetratricopeptide repeat protein [Ferrovibrio sp.]MBX3456651.1 sel1 repeat family protein [Ferrovibrio sp.]